jgi:acetyl esterase/lipase
MTPTRNIAYGPLASETMDVYLPPSATPTGAVILIHGGAWEHGNKGLFEYGPSFQHNFAAAYANHGIAVFSINYTLFNGSNGWNDVYGSVEAAVAYIKANAATFNVNPAAIGAVGDSAGAQLASMLGVTGQVAFVGDNSGPVNLTDAALLTNIVTAMAGAANLKADSPLYDIGAATVPFFISQGRNDHTVYLKQATAFDAALKAARVPVTLDEYAGGHVFADAPGAWGVLEREIGWTEGQIARLTQTAAAFAPAGGVSGRFEAGEAVAGPSGLALVEARR